MLEPSVPIIEVEQKFQEPVRVLERSAGLSTEDKKKRCRTTCYVGESILNWPLPLRWCNIMLEPLRQVICTHAYDISYDRYKHIDAIIRDNPAFHLGFDRYNLDASQRQRKSDEVFIAVERLGETEGLTRDEKRFVYSRLNQFCDGGIALDVMINSLKSFASQAQAEYWTPLIESYQVQFGFAQTELGHGTEMHKLETTAYYDPLNSEFVLNSPTLSSFKWWIGCSEYTTHLMTLAQVTIQGKQEGLFLFIVQIRDTRTFELLPGVISGTIGPRAGQELQSYWYFAFTNLRVPASSLLQRFVRLSPKGELELLHANAKQLVGSALLYLRTLLASWSWRPAALALTIAVRYSDFRVQFSTLDNSTQERKVLDYQLQQLKLIPPIAHCVAQLFAGKHLFALFYQYDQAASRGDFSLLTEMTALSAICKASYTWTTLSNLEVCRRACGGHGFSAYSGIPQLFLNYMPTVTFEGDNTLLSTLPSRYLLTALGSLKAGKQVVGDCRFLIDEQPLSKDFLSEAFGTQVFGRITAVLTALLQTKTQKLVKSGMKPSVVADSFTQQDAVLIGKAYNRYFTHKSFVATILSVTDAQTRRVLTLLRQVYVVTEVLEFGSFCIKGGLFTAADITTLRSLIPVLFKELRPSLHLIVNSFDFSDTFLCSALGRKEGKVYETLLGLARDNPVNLVQPHPAVLKYVKPLARL
jgi:acyl-CoA oxidase